MCVLAGTHNCIHTYMSCIELWHKVGSRMLFSVVKMPFEEHKLWGLLILTEEKLKYRFGLQNNEINHTHTQRQTDWGKRAQNRKETFAIFICKTLLLTLKFKYRGTRTHTNTCTSTLISTFVQAHMYNWQNAITLSTTLTRTPACIIGRIVT